MFGFSWLKDLQQRGDVFLVDWPTLRDIATSQGMLSALRYVQDPADGTYYVTLEISRFWTFLSTFSPSHAYSTEFISTYINQIVNPVTQAGLSSVTVMDTPDDISDYRKSWEYDALPNAWSIWDISVDSLALGSKAVYMKGGEYRIFGPAAKGSKLTFAIVDRDDVFGMFALYGLTRTRLTGLTAKAGTWAIGDTVTGAGGAVGSILAIGADYFDIKASFTGTWVDGEALVGSNGGTATLGTYVEGAFIELQRSLDEDSVRDGDKGKMKPGGAKKMIPGTYFRVSCFNSSLTTNIEFRATLELGR